MLLKLSHHLLKSCVKPGLLLGVLRKGNSLISWKDKGGWENLCLMTASTTEAVNTEKLEVVKGTVTLVMDKWRPGNCFSGGTWEWAACSSRRISSCWGTYWSFLMHWSPVRQPQHPEMGDWSTELGAACFLVASDTLWGVWFHTAQWLYDVVPWTIWRSAKWPISEGFYVASGVLWDAHQLCIQAQGTMLMPSARTLLMASFSTKISGKDGESGCALHHWSGKAEKCIRTVPSQWNSCFIWRSKILFSLRA